MGEEFDDYNEIQDEIAAEQAVEAAEEREELIDQLEASGEPGALRLAAAMRETDRKKSESSRKLSYEPQP
jgi:hypothetical protein